MEGEACRIDRPGWLGCLQCGKGGDAKCQTVDGRGFLYVEEAFGPAFLERGQLGIDVYGGWARIAWLYGMGLEGAGVAIAGDERPWDFSDGIQSIERGRPKAEIGTIYEWDGIRYVVDTLAMSYEKHVTDKPEVSRATARYAAEYIKRARPALLNIVFDEPDHVGHEKGHDTADYYRKLAELDGYVGQILQAIDEAGIREETIVIVTADHGGIEKGHGGKTMMEMETPFIIQGKGIKRGYEFQESMMQFDCAATIAYIFGLEQPQVWIGRPMTQVFE